MLDLAPTRQWVAPLCATVLWVPMAYWLYRYCAGVGFFGEVDGAPLESQDDLNPYEDKAASMGPELEPLEPPSKPSPSKIIDAAQ